MDAAILKGSTKLCVSSVGILEIDINHLAEVEAEVVDGAPMNGPVPDVDLHFGGVVAFLPLTTGNVVNFSYTRVHKSQMIITLLRLVECSKTLVALLPQGLAVSEETMVMFELPLLHIVPS